jgi:hypothetical protein
VGEQVQRICRKEKASKVLGILILASLLVSAINQPAIATQELPSSFNGGAINGSMVMQPKDSPYEITSPIDIPEGSTLTINPGVRIEGKSQVVFRVQGALISVGSLEKPVIISVRDVLLQTIETPNREDAQRVDLSFTHISGGRNFEMSTKEFRLVDSEILNQTNCNGQKNAIKIAKSAAVFARNYFKTNCGFDFNVTFGVFGPRASFTASNNHFDGDSGASAWISVTALWRDSLTLSANTFSNSKKKIIETGFFKTNVFADGNFWGGLSLEDARKLVDSSIPDTFNPALVTLDNQLAEASTSTPAGQRFNLTLPAPKVTTPPGDPKVTKPSPKPIKYKNCAALNKVYSGGVAKSAKSKNKGGEIKLKPTVNAKVYDLNKALDRDKDGLACER